MPIGTKDMEGVKHMYGNKGYRSGGYQDRGFSQGSPSAPVQVGEELDVKIEAVGEKGDGIAKKNGFVLFVPNTSEGDEVRIKITKVLRKVGFADVVGKAGEKKESAEKTDEAETEGAKESESFGEGSEPSEPTSEEETPEEESSGEDSDNFGEEKEEE